MDFERLMAFRKTINGKPDKYDRALIDLYRPWLSFYKTVLYGDD